MSIIDDIPQPELDRIAAELLREYQAGMEAKLLGMFTSNMPNAAAAPAFEFIWPEPVIEVYRPEPRPFFFPWYEGIVMPKSALLNITVCDSEPDPIPMRPKTFLQIVDACARSGATIEQIALRKVTVRVGRMRWTHRLMPDGLWHVKP